MSTTAKPGDYWYGVDVVARMDLRMLKQIEETMRKARENAQRQIKEAADNRYGYRHHTFYPFGDMTQDGPDLARLYLRVYLDELSKLMKERVQAAKDLTWQWDGYREAYNHSLDNIAARWPEYWPQDMEYHQK